MLQVERVGHALNVAHLAHRILLCQVLVNVARLLPLWVKRAPDIPDRVPIYKPVQRPHGTIITLQGKLAVKEISNSEAFYAEFGHSFEAIQVLFFAMYRNYINCSDTCGKYCIAAEF